MMQVGMYDSDTHRAVWKLTNKRFSAWLVGIIALVFFIVPAITASAAVIDTGHFFSPSDIVLANQMISQMEAKTGKNILVQTYAAIPPAIVREYPHTTVHQLFYRWAGAIGKAHHVNGIVILICRQPGYLIIRSGKATLKSVFARSDQARASELMLDLFRAGQYQGGLLTGLRFITRTIEQKSQQRQLPGGAAVGAMAAHRAAAKHRIIILILVLVGIFILFWLVTRRSRAAPSPMMGGPNGGINPQTAGLTPETTVPGSGTPTGGTSAMGSFMSGLAGGAVGAVAGNMLFNAMDGNTSALEAPLQGGMAAPPDTSSTEGATTNPPSPDNASDWSNAGSDDAAGGAFGGSDADTDADSADDTTDADDDTSDDSGDVDGGSF